MELRKAFTWTDRGYYYWAKRLSCSFTDKDGREVENFVLFHPDDDIESQKREIEVEFSKRAIIAGETLFN